MARRQPKEILLALALAVVAWMALIFEYRLALEYLGLRLDIVQTIGVLTAARIAFLLPVPSGLGALEISQVLAMQALGMSPAFGISMSVLIRLRDVLFGGLGLGFGGIRSGQR